MPVSDLPDFPWDSLDPYRERARAVSGGIVDLSVGTPVDPTPSLVTEALAGAADAPGYPQVYGTPDLRSAVAAWFARRRGVPDVDPAGVMPTIGSKEIVAWLPMLMGLGAGDVVGYPSIAYPTYAVGATLAGATGFAADATTAFGPITSASAPKLLWLNSPSNPSGKVLGIAHLAKVVAWARSYGIVVASDECYAELDWRPEDEREGLSSTPSLLDPRVTGGSHEGLLVVYSLSKQSNLAGYRAAFAAGDPALVTRLVRVRQHAGMIMPWPVQRAMIAALGDDSHVVQNKARYAARRDVLAPALARAGFRIDDSQAGLYLWATRDQDCWGSVADLADLGILVTPGDFYGAGGRRHVRIALTASDAHMLSAAERLTNGSA
ncbi:MAG: succinyldiaminopimelate transaminase [Nostocoides sp.]